ncbi:hypothetical protein OSB04_002651 [Centaurea solstitialis]|uniref:Uncharacterized protein n=1 Tax=Centaurea solstitialis TaxID=347529 RepID=A0AA38TTD6_9ASTR|nr:hypothetical protein OSB04_002651 [Centaurea solstitialis]
MEILKKLTELLSKTTEPLQALTEPLPAKSVPLSRHQIQSRPHLYPYLIGFTSPECIQLVTKTPTEVPEPINPLESNPTSPSITSVEQTSVAPEDIHDDANQSECLHEVTSNINLPHDVKWKRITLKPKSLEILLTVSKLEPTSIIAYSLVL